MGRQQKSETWKRPHVADSAKSGGGEAATCRSTQRSRRSDDHEPRARIEVDAGGREVVLAVELEEFRRRRCDRGLQSQLGH